MPVRLSVALLLLLCAGAGCQGDSESRGVDLSPEHFGCEFPLLTPLQTLQTRVNSSSLTFDLPAKDELVRVMTAQELAQQDPTYQRATALKDLLYVVVGQPPRSVRNAKGMAVVEFRAYPIEGKDSKITLHYRKLRELDPDLADKMLQATGSRTVENDATHCVYLLPYRPNPKLHLELTLSFQSKKGCYAAKLRLIEPSPKF